jgi:hypothetical protein
MDILLVLENERREPKIIRQAAKVRLVRSLGCEGSRHRTYDIHRLTLGVWVYENGFDYFYNALAYFKRQRDC